MNDITGLLNSENISGYLRPIETKADWISYRDSHYPLNSASKFEQRFNASGQVAYYLASGEKTAQLNVPDWENKAKCLVSPQTLNCFDLPSFSKDHGIYEDYLKSKKEDGYPLPQATADFLFEKHGITGILYTSYPDYQTGKDGLCIVLRPQDGKFVDETFFIT